MADRKSMILQMLSEEGKIEVATLAQRLGVSQVTMRKDLSALEAQGIIKREHGAAYLASPDDIEGRMALQYGEKARIAHCAARMVSDGDTVMIENGSCCALLAAELAETKRNLTLITNSAFIASYVRNRGDVQVILLGGIYQHDAQVMVGPMVARCAEGFFVERFFIGVDGYSSRMGFTNRDQMRAQAVSDMAARAEQVVVLTQSKKFSSRGVVPLDLGDRLRTVVTDEGVPADVAKELSGRGVDLMLAVD